MISLDQLPFEAELKDLLSQEAHIIDIEAGAMLLREGAYVSAVPIVLDGLIKVERVEEERELLLYYIQPGESCVMSFTAALQDQTSQVVARVELDSRILLLPAAQLEHWHRKYPRLQQFFVSLYHQRYQGLIATINQLAFHKLDERICHYLRNKHELLNQPVLSLTHQQIASEMGTTREVVSRVLKKLEQEGRVSLQRNAVRFIQ